MFIDFREKGRERDIDVREKHGSIASHMCPDLSICSDKELNPQNFGVQDDALVNWATPVRAPPHL